MRYYTFHLAALAGLTVAKSIPHAGNKMHSPDGLTITPEEVDILDLYADYTASAPCNNETAIGDPVTCYQNCDRVESDGAIVIASYKGEITEFAAYMAVVESREQIIFVGRGSATNKNWLTTFNTTLLNSDLVDGGKVHSGFSTAWSEISEEVMSTLEDAVAKYPGYDIIFTGGSLGGAIATLGAANVRSAGYPVDLYTYGAPRIGNDILSDFITNQPGKLYRVTYRHDPVPRLPSPLIDPPFLPDWPEYRHVSPEYWLTGEPADPDRWPIEDIKICEGNWSFECIGTIGNPFDWTLKDHQFYFGPLQCWKDAESGPIGFVYPDEAVWSFVESAVTEGTE